VTQSSTFLALVEERVWFCLRAEPKREHLAATALRRRFGIECLSPRLRFRKLTRRGPVWFVEAMFPGYFVCELCLFHSASGRRKLPRNPRDRSVWRPAGNPSGTYSHSDSVKGGRRRSGHGRFFRQNWSASSHCRGPFSRARGCSNSSLTRERTNSRAARVSRPIARNRSSCGKSPRRLSRQAGTQDKVAVPEQPLCFPSVARTGTLFRKIVSIN
jgi:hypothetical protein